MFWRTGGIASTEVRGCGLTETACLDYAMHSGMEGVPTDDEVVYGKVGAFGKLVHVSQIDFG